MAIFFHGLSSCGASPEENKTFRTSWLGAISSEKAFPTAAKEEEEEEGEIKRRKKKTKQNINFSQVDRNHEHVIQYNTSAVYNT